MTLALAFLAVFVANTVQGSVPPIIGIIRADSAHVLFGLNIVPLYNQGGGHSNILIDNGRHGTYLYRGGQSPDTVPFLKFDSTFIGYGNGSDVGDVNADGYDDFVLLWGYSNRARLNLYYGGPSLDLNRALWYGLDSFQALGPARICNNLRGDGQRYLVSGGTSINFGNVLLFNLGVPADTVPEIFLRPTGIPPINSTQLGTDIAFGDFNGDGITDIAASLVMSLSSTRPGEVWIYFGGSVFDTLPSLILRRPGPFQQSNNQWGTNVECPGDLNGDGFDDLIVAGAGQDTTTFLYFGSTAFDTVPELSIAPSGEFIRSAGDINGDGYPDFFQTTPLPFSGGNKVNLYYGGPSMSVNPGLTIYDWEISGYHTGFGSGCTGIGDFDGDGSDDFAFTLYDNDTRGWVYIFSGQKKTDAPPAQGPATPRGFQLRQCYPNPFNGSTTVQFSVSRRSSVKIYVVNVTGQVVNTVIDRVLPAGNYSRTWNSHNLASGVYFCVMDVDSLRLTRKMVLLK